jgi:hypothetical protein
MIITGAINYDCILVLPNGEIEIGATVRLSKRDAEHYYKQLVDAPDMTEEEYYAYCTYPSSPKFLYPHNFFHGWDQ